MTKVKLGNTIEYRLRLWYVWQLPCLIEKAMY